MAKKAKPSTERTARDKLDALTASRKKRALGTERPTPAAARARGPARPNAPPTPPPTTRLGGVDFTLDGHLADPAAWTPELANDLAAALDALATATVSGMRMEVTTAPSGATIVNDAYNANPTSMLAALEALAAMDARRRVAVLGLMGEIDDPEPAHRAIADRAVELGIDLIAVGTDLYGRSPMDDPVAVLGALGAGDVVLVKASRAAGLERVVAEFAVG